MRTAKSIILDILNEELGCNESNEYIVTRIIYELHLVPTVVKHSYNHYSKKEKENRNEDELYKNILNCIGNENTAVRIYSILRRNSYNTTEKLLELDGKQEDIARMRNCGKLTTEQILQIIRDLKNQQPTLT